MADNFLEKDLEQILYETDPKLLIDRGLDIFDYHRIYRQFKIGNFGIADIVTTSLINGCLYIHIYELKNKTLNAATFWQLIRYIRGIKHFSRKLRIKFYKIYVHGVMVGREVDSSNEFCYLPHLGSDISFFTYEYKFDGIYFDRFYGYNLKIPGELSVEQLGFDNMIGFYREMITCDRALKT